MNEEIIQRFYTAFQKLDYKAMQDCYSQDIIFNDPVFGVLQGDEARAMWEMLCKQATNFSLTFSDIRLLDQEYATCNWTATYTFSKTGRPVVNNVKAHMRIQDNKITEHTDQFSLNKWCRQALGIAGMLLGWSSLLQNKIRKQARGSLRKFMRQMPDVEC
jgi:ketosteroid isomerase-like protein